MRFNDNDRKQITVTATTNVDSSTATAKLIVDGSPYPVSWDGPAVASNGTWRRVGHTDSYFAGPSVTNANGATVLQLGPHTAELEVTIGQTIVACPLIALTVRR